MVRTFRNDIERYTWRRDHAVERAQFHEHCAADQTWCSMMAPGTTCADHANLAEMERDAADEARAMLEAARKYTDGDIPDARQLYSSIDTATKLGISQRRVQQLAESRGVGRLLGGSLVLTGSEVEQLRDRRPGRPRSV